MADTRSKGSPVPIPPDVTATLHPCAAIGTERSIPPPPEPARSPLAEGELLLYILDRCLISYELHPFFRITHWQWFLVQLRSATSLRSRVFSDPTPGVEADRGGSHVGSQILQEMHLEGLNYVWLDLFFATLGSNLDLIEVE